MRHPLIFALTIVAIALVVAGCGKSDDTASQTESEPIAPDTGTSRGIRVISPRRAAAIQADPPEGLFILDVRTPEEFDEGHLDGAVMIDFYHDDFAEQIADLDRDRPYLIYCRSGNRSGQTRSAMEELGFTDVADIDGGVLAWTAAQLPLAQ